MIFFKSLKFKILLVGISLSIVLSLVLSVFIYEYLKKSYTEKQIEYTAFNLQLIMNNIEKEYIQIMRFGSALSNEESIHSFLTYDGKATKNEAYLQISAFKAAQNQFLNVPLAKNIEKCMIFSDRGVHIQLGMKYGHETDFNYRFSQNLKENQIKVHGIVDSPYFYFPNEKIIPISVPIYSTIGSKRIGWADIIVNTNLITEYIPDEVFEGGSRLFIIIEDNMYEILKSHISDKLTETKVPMDYTLRPLSNNIFLLSNDFQASSSASVLVTSSTINWALVQTLPKFSLSNISSSEYRTMILAIFAIILIAAFAVLGIFGLINKPIARIINRIEHIASGDFSYDPLIEGDDELGQIGKGINLMSKDLKKWIETSLEHERLKKNYEFKMLQNQINPHFLYNTLNSIKWMGSMQRSTGIVEVTTALINMLRKVSKIDTETITIEEELKFISDYATIQKYRYGNMFTVEYNVEKQELYQAKIIKFSLQPLVENAIFHGIEPKNKPGKIKINIYTDKENGDVLLIEVIDDGVGLLPDELAELNKRLHTIEDNTASIGLPNIHQRIVMEYGDQHGLSIKSEKDKYTCVTMRLPLIY